MDQTNFFFPDAAILPCIWLLEATWTPQHGVDVVFEWKSYIDLMISLIMNVKYSVGILRKAKKKKKPLSSVFVKDLL